MRVKVGMVDSGVSLAQAGALVASVAVATASGGVTRCSPVADALGHGTAVAAILLEQAPVLQLASVQAFHHARHADPACVADGIRWCLEQHVRLINLSLGLTADHPDLRRACQAAAANGVVLVAAFPARGGSVYPAAYPGVLAVCGDARCDTRAWSVVEPDRLYGMAVVGADGQSRGGASYAAARLSALVARRLAAEPGEGASGVREWLQAGAAFHGRERHRVMESA